MRKFVSLALAMLIIMCSLGMPAKAVDSDVGSIRIRVEYKNEKITGGELIAVRVGYVDADRQVFRKVTNHDEIKNIGRSDAVTQMQNFYSANKHIYPFLTYKAEVKDGATVFSGIPRGLYLIYQETPAPGYEALTAFLVTVPYEGKLDVTVFSKSSLEREPEPEATTPSSGSGTGSGGNKLPQTGQLTWPIPWMALTGMLLFFLGWWLCFGKRKDSE